MPRSVDYYFTVLSPWSYIGHALFMDIARRHGVGVNYKPVYLGTVFDKTGGLPLQKRHPARQRYRMMELQRWRDRRGMKFVLEPKHWPFDVRFADRLVIAVAGAGHDPDAFLRRAFAAIWEKELDLTDETVLADLVRAAGLDPEPLFAAARGDATEVVYGLNLENAIDAGIFGAPSYVVDGEIFWGQDRLELLDHMLASGRKAFRAVA